MSTYLLIEFPDLETGIKTFFLAKEYFHTRCSCLGRSETNPTVAYIVFKEDVDVDLYNQYKQELPNTCTYKEVTI